MKIETEIKLILGSTNIEDLTNNIEKTFNLKRTPSFHQTTHQFFYEDYTKQTAFPRVRNEEDGRYTLTVKAKIKDESGKDSDYFKRIELDTNISDTEAVIRMMPFFGFPKKVSWEKKRTNFISLKHETLDFAVSLDETPMGFFLEIESTEERIEEVIKTLGLQGFERTKKHI